MLNEWEQALLKQEMQREDFRFWYRNPNRPSQDSLGIAYGEGVDINIMHPDFLFFAQSPDGSIAVDMRPNLGSGSTQPDIQTVERWALARRGITMADWQGRIGTKPDFFLAFGQQQRPGSRSNHRTGRVCHV